MIKQIKQKSCLAQAQAQATKTVFVVMKCCQLYLNRETKRLASPQKRDKFDEKEGQSEHVRPRRVIKPTKKALEFDQNAGKSVSSK